MPASKLLFALICIALTVSGCGKDERPTIETAETQTTPTDVVEQAAEARTEQSDQLAAVEESDGSFDAEAEAREVTLRMAQETAPSAPQRFRAGTHFDRFQPSKATVTGTDGIEVAEVFWYGCNHCYNLEPTLKRWSSDLPQDVEFVKMPAVWNPLLETHAQLFYTIEALGGTDALTDKDKVHQAVFDEIHLNRKMLRTEREIKALLEQYGVDDETFEASWNSFEVNTRLRQAKSLNRAYQIASVPTMIVNGRYKTSEVQAGGKPELIAVIDELVASER
ncbi:MAG: thiol:disulfide interchange protein DsbA/DsbL [Pseudomonadota bacterium]